MGNKSRRSGSSPIWGRWPVLALLIGCLLLGCLWLVWPAPRAAALDSGSFFTLVNAYAYQQGPRGGDRVLLRARHAFTVVDFTADAEDVLWYQVVHPERTQRSSGNGWIALAPHELAQLGPDPVLVFPELTASGAVASAAREIGAHDLTLANETRASDALPELVWQKVDYTTEVPRYYWIRSTTGIYRPFRSQASMTDVHAEMVSNNVAAQRIRRLLSGIVRIGDATHEVTWALGEPTQREESTTEGLNIMVWHYPGFQVRFENEIVEQIN